MHIYIENPLLDGMRIVVTTPTTLLPPQGISVHDHIRVLGKEQEEQDEQEESYFLADVILPFNGIDKKFRMHREEMILQGGHPPPPLER